VTVATRFNELLDISGVVLTKMDGDARGGAALSVKSITGKPIKFVGMGEKLNELEVFHPDRAASRILGMGDVLTLIEKAQSAIDEKEAAELEKKFRKAEFDLEDFRSQMRKLKKLGSIEGLLKLIPGMGDVRKQLKDVKMPEKELGRVEAIISSMTAEERKNPGLINGSRRKRIAAGSGTKVQDVNQLLSNFTQMKKMMQHVMQKGGRPGQQPLPVPGQGQKARPKKEGRKSIGLRDKKLLQKKRKQAKRKAGK
jgi:signal recognition particle subunit SRP54